MSDDLKSDELGSLYMKMKIKQVIYRSVLPFPVNVNVNTMFTLGLICRVASISHPNPHLNNKGQTTTPGTSCPTLCDKRVGSLTSPANHNIEDAGDGAYSL